MPSKRFLKRDTVRTTSSLLERHAFLAPRANQDARRADCPGVVAEYLGDTYLVQHEGKLVLAVYEECELVPELAAYWEVRFSLAGVPYYKEFATYTEAGDFIVEEGKANATIHGPFYQEKTLREGPLETKSLFDHLTDDI